MSLFKIFKKIKPTTFNENQFYVIKEIIKVRKFDRDFIIVNAEEGLVKLIKDFGWKYNTTKVGNKFTIRLYFNENSEFEIEELDTNIDWLYKKWDKVRKEVG